MTDIARKSVNQFSRQMRHIFGTHLSKVIVYGSYARGDYKNNSDIDIMVLVDLTEEEIKKMENAVYDFAFDIEMNTGIDISPVIKSEMQYNDWADVLPYYRNVREEGIIVNGEGE
ncbi:MAG: nucleotidyltransferase domain-containing protein [Eubacteriales bacterium]|nr:nucleotidyltransferase domain-containing protein [Eubacteriales bacterium]